MDSNRLQQEFIHSISRSEDFEFLNATKTILDYKTKDNFIELTADQEKKLIYASNEGKKGQVISQSEMNEKVEQWLNER